MRYGLALALLLISLPAAAQHEYVIPFAGDVEGAGAFYRASPRLTNLGSARATVRVGEVYPMAGVRCRENPNLELWTIEAGQTLGFFPFTCDGLYAVSVTSSEVLGVAIDLYTFLATPSYRIERLPLTVDGSWLASGVTALFPSVGIGLTPWDANGRATLFVVGNADRPVEVRVTQTGPCRRSQTDRYLIPGKTLQLIALPDLRQNFCGGDVGTAGLYDVEVTADAPLSAIISEVHGARSAVHTPYLRLR